MTEAKVNGPGTLAAALPRTAGLSRRSNAQAIGAALGFLLLQQRDGHWSDFNFAGRESDVWVTAHVLARLGEIPSYFLSDAMRVHIRTSLDWLLAARTPRGAWGHSSGAEADVDSTAWAVIALRRHGRKVPDAALELIRECFRPDGGTAACPETNAAGPGKASAPDVTALAANALRELAPDAAEYLDSWLLRNRLTISGCRVPSPLYIFSAVLDLGRGSVPLSLADKLRNLLGHASADDAFERALLLRCLLQLRLQRAWWVAVSLRRMQQPDGSWPSAARACPVLPDAPATESSFSFDKKRIFTTATAVASLVMAESQPGLYFGSDMPLPRRLYES